MSTVAEALYAFVQPYLGPAAASIGSFGATQATRVAAEKVRAFLRGGNEPPPYYTRQLKNFKRLIQQNRRDARKIQKYGMPKRRYRKSRKRSRKRRRTSRKKYSRKRRKFSRKRRKRNPFKAGFKPLRLRAAVRSLKKKVSGNMSRYTQRERGAGSIAQVNFGENTWQTLFLSDKTEVLNKINAVPVYDQTTNTYIPINYTDTSSNLNRQITYKGKMKVQFINPLAYAVRVKVYYLSVKQDGSIDPETAMLNGLAHAKLPGTYVPAPAAFDNESWGVEPSDSAQLMDMWKIFKVKKRTLQPGEGFSCVIAHGVKEYNAQTADHDRDYQREFGTKVLLIRIQGPLAHNASTTVPYREGKARLNYYWTTRYNSTYDGGPGGHYQLRITDNTTAPAAADKVTINNAVTKSVVNGL